MNRAAKLASRVATVVWASPASLLGLTAGLLGLVTGGGVQRSGPILEFWGGLVTWLLRHAPLVKGALAMTLGHVVLGQSRADLARCRAHELVHVRQYQRWGPLFLPAYLDTFVEHGFFPASAQ